MEALKHYQEIELELATMTRHGDIQRLPPDEMVHLLAMQTHLEQAIRLNIRKGHNNKWQAV